MNFTFHEDMVLHTIAYLAVDAADLRQIVAAAVGEALASHPITAHSEPPVDDELMTRAAVARMLHLSLVTLRELERRGELVPHRIARRVLYKKSDVLGTLEKRGGN